MSSSAPVGLRGKSILITGGSMGIGLECARVCLSSGANVMICARGEASLTEAQSALSLDGRNDRVATATADVGDPSDVDRAFSAFGDRFGDCDGVIHAAAILGPIGAIVDTDPSQWWDCIRINLFGTFLVARAAAQRMAIRGKGRIVLFAGGGASGPFPNYTAYASSKVAIVRFTETIAAELGPAVEVNCVAPGFVPTRMHAETLAAGERAGAEYLQRTRDNLAGGATPPSVGAEAAAFLVSDAARGISGKFIAPVFDQYRSWKQHPEMSSDRDLFTLRRILPRDRGMDWQ